MSNNSPGIDEVAATTQRSRTMPDKAPHTKAEKREAVEGVMGEFKRGELRSGSPEGPPVTNPKQAVAVAMSESGQARGAPHKFDRPPSKPASGYGHPAPLRSGHLRNSGHGGAHRIGKR